MAHDIALNRLDHDLTLRLEENGRWSLILMEGADRVAQQIKMNLLTFLGEWFLDVTWGVPYLEEILVKNPRMAAVHTILRGHINSVPDVIRIDTLDLNWDRQARTLRVDFACTTNLGPVKDSFRLELYRGGTAN